MPTLGMTVTQGLGPGPGPGPGRKPGTGTGTRKIPCSSILRELLKPLQDTHSAVANKESLKIDMCTKSKNEKGLSSSFLALELKVWK
ncbi:hypothetical protein BPOR_1568g00020 [Botrytis porri]|uniref:Uncharacterized protein n=1 Tax=Botrytis porri TaxID=87229 RepID=A0A4Z1K9T6_9HELO|nr:hypothetical protein BPOR_1568g00020 [Botrytis porri]